MNSTLRIYIVLLIAIFIGILMIEFNRPQPLDWSPNYYNDKKTPYGLYILDKEFKSIFPKTKVNKITNTPFEYFDEKYDVDSKGYAIRGSYLSIQHKDNLDEESAKEILYFVSHGNEAFISSNTFPKLFRDSLHISWNSEYFVNDSLKVKLNYIDTNTYILHKINHVAYFDSINSDFTDVIGNYISSDSQYKRINFIRVKYINGYLFLHTHPAAFSNYHLLKGKTHRYASTSLSFIQHSLPIHWNMNRKIRMDQAETPMRVILSYPSLRWAWYFLLFGFMLYLIFNAKRKQRIVPIITPLQNTSIEFSKTIANLFYQEKNYQYIFDKKIIYFLERVRTEFHLDTQILDDRFIQRLALKSGHSEGFVKRLILKCGGRKIRRYQSEQDLIELNEMIEKFWNKS